MLEFTIFDRFKSKEFIILQNIDSDNYIQLCAETVEKDFIKLDKKYLENLLLFI